MTDTEPSVERPPLQPLPLSARVVWAWRLAWLSEGVLAAAAGAAIAWVFELDLPPLAPVALIVALFALLLAVVPPARYRSWSVVLRASDIVIRHGILWRTTSVVPYARIQHVDTRKGPLERALGLARVVIFTAGVKGATLTIPGLDARNAGSVRDRLAALGGEDDAV